MVKYYSIEPKNFYVIFNTLRLYFTKNYNINKYGLYSGRFYKRYKNDKLVRVYETIAKKLRNEEEAILQIVANFIDNPSCFITDFELDSDTYNKFKRYKANKRALLDDFKDLVDSDNEFCAKLNSDRLANEVIIGKRNIVLMLFINKLVPIVTLSKQQSNNTDTLMELFHDTIDTEEKSIFDKASVFVHLNISNEQKKQMVDVILDIIKVCANKPKP